MIRKTHTGTTASFPTNVADVETLEHALDSFAYLIPANSVVDYNQFANLIETVYGYSPHPRVLACLNAVKDAASKSQYHYIVNHDAA